VIFNPTIIYIFENIQLKEKKHAILKLSEWHINIYVFLVSYQYDLYKNTKTSFLSYEKRNYNIICCCQ